MDETIYDSSQVYVADLRIDGAGLGVFAARSFTAGELVETPRPSSSPRARRNAGATSSPITAFSLTTRRAVRSSP